MMPWAVFASFGVSLFSVWDPWESLIPFTVSVSDFVIAATLLYSIFRVGRGVLNTTTYAAGLLAIAVLMGGVINAWIGDTFDIANFAVNYLRVIAVVMMVLLLPPLIVRIGNDRLARATMWVVRVQCVLVLVDWFYPIRLGLLPPDAELQARASGLFVESGWFGVWLGFSIFYLGQAQKNLKRQYISALDFALIGIAVIMSTGMRGVLMVGFALFVLLVMDARLRLRLFGVVAIAIVLLFAVQRMYPNSADGSGSTDLIGITAPPGLGYVLYGLRGFNPFALSDASAVQGLYQSGRIARIIITDMPWGIGLGGANQDRIGVKYYDPNAVRAFNSDPATASTYSNPAQAIMWVTVLAAAGLPGVFIFLFIVIRMLMLREMRIFGIGFLAGSVLWAGAFDIMVWWHVCLAIALVSSKSAVLVEPSVATGPRLTSA
jgi:hypothetical protein